MNYFFYKIVILGISLFLFSCFTLGDDITWDKKRKVGSVAAIVNDSLALIPSRRCYEGGENFFGTTGDGGCTNSGLHLVNYHKKQPQLWSDTLGYDFFYISQKNPRANGQLTDSVVYSWIWNEAELQYWKIGSKPIKKKQKLVSRTCISGSFSGKIRTWKDNRLFMFYNKKPAGGDTCQYALFDTATGHREEHRFIGELSWLAETECEDIRYMAGQMICLRRNVDDECAFDLLAWGELKSTLVVKPCENGISQIDEIFWYGNYVGVEMLGGAMNYTELIYKVIPQELVFDNLYPNVNCKCRNTIDSDNGCDFINDDGSTIRYDVNVDLK